MDIFVIILLILILTAGISIVGWSLKNGISPMPTSPKVKSSLFTLLPNDLNGTIYELGSGWGTLVIPLGRKFPRNQVIGFETSPIPFWISRVWLRCANLSNLTLLQKDFFSVNLSDASLVVCYLYPGAMKRLKGKLQAELKPGTLVVSNTFAIPGWNPEKIIDVDDIYNTKIYLYKVLSTNN